MSELEIETYDFTSGEVLVIEGIGLDDLYLTIPIKRLPQAIKEIKPYTREFWRQRCLEILDEDEDNKINNPAYSWGIQDKSEQYLKIKISDLFKDQTELMEKMIDDLLEHELLANEAYKINGKYYDKFALEEWYEEFLQTLPDESEDEEE